MILPTMAEHQITDKLINMLQTAVKIIAKTKPKASEMYVFCYIKKLFFAKDNYFIRTAFSMTTF